MVSLRLRRFGRFSFPFEQGCRDAGIGWHRDKTQFDEVVGVSLLAPSVLRFRRKAAETGDRVSFLVESCWPHRVGAQSSRARLASSFNYHTDARCKGAFWRGGHARLRSISLRSFRLRCEKATGSVTELCSRECHHDRRVEGEHSLAGRKCHAEACRAPAAQSMATLRRLPQ
jgi:hypothetical protein